MTTIERLRNLEAFTPDGYDRMVVYRDSFKALLAVAEAAKAVLWIDAMGTAQDRNEAMLRLDKALADLEGGKL